MIPGKASRTAQYVALFRAMESARPAGERLFDDPYAPLFLRPFQRLLVWASRLPGIGRPLARYVDRASYGAMSSAIGRTRWIDDALRKALASGVEQVVILGTGFDCRAYRIAGIDQARVFEVDHPDTLARRVYCLKDVAPAATKHIRRVATDFNEHDLRTAMHEAGFNPGLRTFFLWEGVTGYLTDEAVDATLRWIAEARPSSQVVFTYLHRRVIENPSSFPGAERVVRIVAQAGEPWRFGLLPEELPRFLAERGLKLIEDLGADDYRRLYGVGDDRPDQGYSFYRLVLAEVSG